MTQLMFKWVGNHAITTMSYKIKTIITCSASAQMDSHIQMMMFYQTLKSIKTVVLACLFLKVAKMAYNKALVRTFTTLRFVHAAQLGR